jgi:signal transduction histidine kinase
LEEDPGYWFSRRVERTLAAGRVLLAVSFLLAFVLDPIETGRDATWVRQIAIAFVAYAVAVAVLVSSRWVPAPGIPLTTHVVDLLLFSSFAHFSADGPMVPVLLTFFIFVVVSGGIRWPGGAIITGVVGLGAYLGVALWSVANPGRSFELNRVITRSAQFGLVTALLAYLSTYQHRFRSEMARLGAWPRSVSSGPELAVRDVLTHAAGILRAPRMILAWHEQEEPLLHIASSDGDRYELSELDPDTSGPLVAEPLQHASFLCTDVSSPSCVVVLRAPNGFRLWRGAPLGPILCERYNIKTVLALRIVMSGVEGWLFAVNRTDLLVDDLLVGGVVSQLVGATLDQQTQLNQLRDAAIGQERLRLARELHDGVLQALTGLALQAGRLRKLMARDPAQAESVLEEIEEAVLTEQRALRSVVEELKPGHTIEGSEPDCAGRLREVATRVAAQWDVRVHLELAQDTPPLPRRLSREVCRMAQESMVNAIRHGAAKDVRLQWGADADHVNLTVAYAGRGFATFRGRHDLESLNRMKAGPLSLKQRVSELRGALIINSDDDGASVDIAIPLTSGAVSNDTRLTR